MISDRVPTGDSFEINLDAKISLNYQLLISVNSDDTYSFAAPPLPYSLVLFVMSPLKRMWKHTTQQQLRKRGL